jgi:hypothetical protein
MNNALLSTRSCFVTFRCSPHRMYVGWLPALSREWVARNGAFRGF